MGLFDSVMVTCPSCGGRVEFQSKQGNCQCDVFSLDDAPEEILTDIMNDPYYCRCGQWLALIDPRYPPGQKPRPELRVAKVTAPDNPDTHEQGWRWWPSDRQFTYADLEPNPVDQSAA